MGTGQPYLNQATAPGLGRGWTRVAEAVAQAVPPREVVRIWVFTPLRREQREWGTAVIARDAGENRLAILTARYMLITRGNRRGEGKVEVQEVGESPADVAYDVVRGVQERTGETEAPVEISPALWFGEDGDESAAQG